MARPNILLILTDQQSGGALSVAGNPDLQTPAMDGLAAEGVLFDRAYCPQPLCTPSRGSLFSGLMPHQCGTPRNGTAISPELRPEELGRLLNTAGYSCAYGGKWHLPQIAMPPDNDHGFEAIAGFDDNLLAEACTAFLRRHTNRPPADRNPFFLVAGFDNPHNICEWAREMPLPWGDIEEPPAFEHCPGLPANHAPAPFEPEIIRVEQRGHWGIYPYADRSPEDFRRLRWAYFRLIEKVDREIGRVLEGLSDCGLQDDTVVVLSSDHGDAHGAHRWNQKSALFEEIIRVPLLIRAPDATAGLRDREHLISTGPDLYATILDYAGVEVPVGRRGLSLRSLVAAEPSVWRDALCVETLFDGGRGYDTQGRALIAGWDKYVLYDRGRYREQLFNLETDPGEMVNLAVQDRHRGTLERCRALLREQLAQTGDRFTGL